MHRENQLNATICHLALLFLELKHWKYQQVQMAISLKVNDAFPYFLNLNLHQNFNLHQSSQF